MNGYGLTPRFTQSDMALDFIDRSTKFADYQAAKTFFDAAAAEKTQ